jgi:hypothetical protein
VTNLETCRIRNHHLNVERSALNIMYDPIYGKRITKNGKPNLILACRRFV